MSNPSQSERQECRDCKRIKSVDHFPWHKKRQRSIATCFLCTNARTRKYRAAKRDGTFTPVPRTPTVWTPERLREMRACIDAGLTPATTAIALGVTMKTVRRARYEFKLPKFHKWTVVKRVSRNADVNRSREKRDHLLPAVSKMLHVERLSWAQIADRLGVSKGVISGIVHRYREEINAFASV